MNIKQIAQDIYEITFRDKKYRLEYQDWSEMWRVFTLENGRYVSAGVAVTVGSSKDIHQTSEKIEKSVRAYWRDRENERSARENEYRALAGCAERECGVYS